MKMINQNLKNRIVQIAANLYPLGPAEKSVWRRAGGDLSLLNLSEAGRFAWHSAIDQLEKGGGGENISVEGLAGVMLEDFPGNSELQNLAGQFTPRKQVVAAKTIEEEKLEYDAANQPWYQNGFPEMNEIESVELNNFEDQTDVLIFTATNVELQYALGKTLPLKGRKALLQGASGSETYYLGKFGAFNSVLTKTRMGTVGAGAATLAAERAMRLWRPRAAFMTGIAFGKDPAKQHIGEVLVANAVIPYEPRRVGSQAVITRGIALPSDPTLLNRFENAFSWNFTLPNGEKCRSEIGQLLSGNQLIDDEQAKQNLLAEFPTAIGGEMEGAGVYAAALQYRIPALLLKAICDWGDGKKHKAHQPLAAAASASFLHFVLSQKNILVS